MYDGQFVKMTGELVAVEDARKLRMKVATLLWGFRLSYEIPLDRFDACTMMRYGCPMQKGRRYPILSSGIANLPFTGTKRTIEVTLRNENGVLMLCGRAKFRFEKLKKFRNTFG